MGWSESLLVAVLSCATFLLPSLLCGPQYSGNLDINIDQGMIDDIFGSSLDSPRYGNTEEEWVEVPIELLPGEGEECGGMQQPRTEPSMVEMFEELAQIAVIKADGSKKCDFYTQTEGFECVPYYQCDEGTIITDGYGLIDIRFGGSGSGQPELAILDSSDLMCPGSLDVCCKDPDFVPPPPPPIVKYQPKCGRRNYNGLGARIQGFTEAESQFGEWPHMCAVLHEKPVEQEAGYSGEPETVNLYQCGGSLIAPGVLLTAAHCVDKFRQQPGELKIRCGEWDTQHQTEPYPHQDRQVSSLAIHPEFDGRNLQNDFAVLFTSENFLLDQHIDTACLPDAGEVFDGTSCFATGWGKDEFGAAGQYQVLLKEIGVDTKADAKASADEKVE